MPLELVTKCLNVSVAIILVFRLIRLQLLSAYKVLAAFCVFDLFVGLFAFLPWRWLYDHYRIDYRIIWLVERPIGWLLYVWVVYAILHRVMNEHPAILRITRKFFAASFACAILIALVTAHFELEVMGRAGPTLLADLVGRALVLERACLTTSLVLLAVTLSFLLWFPVEVTRNVALVCLFTSPLRPLYFSCATSGPWARTGHSVSASS
jgi:hypothetical protein